MVQAVDLVRRRDMGEGLRLAVNVIQSRPPSAARRHMAGEIIASLPDQGRSLPAVRELREPAGTSPRQNG